MVEIDDEVLTDQELENFSERPSFVGAPRCEDLTKLDADIAVLGVPYRTLDNPLDKRIGAISPQFQAETDPSQLTSDLLAPDAIRQQSLRFAGYLDHYDFDFGGDILAGRAVKIVDCGNIVASPDKYEEIRPAATTAVKAILERGAVPIILGGDHATTIPVLRAYENHGPLCVVQIDAHLDWRDEVNGVREGLSSPMRRASEMPWVQSMIQIGLRGIGSARQGEVDDARAYGSVLIRAEELHQVGVQEVLRQVPPADSYYLSIDADGLDPSIAPGVPAPMPGGLTYYETINLMRGLAEKGKIVGFDYVELVPGLDIGSQTSLFAARIILSLIGVLAHKGQI